MIPTPTTGELALYFHIPFCSYKCPYCHFFVVQDNESLKDKLLQGLLDEIALWKDTLTTHNIYSIYFGGGTPSLFGPARIERLLQALSFSNCEVTLEANPEKSSEHTLKGFFDVGVNRLSLGIQSFDNSELTQLGRRHAAKTAESSIIAAYDAGFRNISIDLMYETPLQTLSSWKNSLKCIQDLPITHLSLYNLTIEPYTPFAKKEQMLRKLIPDAETGTQMYLEAIDALQNLGLKQYEISAFCKDDLYSRHNTSYWLGRPFLGFGPSAFSYYQGKRFRNIANLPRYLALINEKKQAVDFTEEVSNEKRARELLVINLRLMQGADLLRFKLSSEQKKEIELLITQGFLKLDNNNLKLTLKGVLFYDHVASELI